jgi:glyoxylase-like metal-dependent hydrolase (beta-lactamase superfamily II)
VTLPFDELADGVFRRRYASLDLNIGVVIGGDGVLVIDTRASHGQARELLDEVSRLTALPIRWVINTHWHWDHTFGNAMLSGAELWAHRRCREYLREHGEESKRAALELAGEEHRAAIEEVTILPPDHIIEQDGMIDIGGRSVRLEWLGLGHTDSDLVVSVVDAAVLFAGDLLEQGAPPQFSDGYPLAWQDTAAALRSRVRGITVPGHGDVMDKDAVATQVEELAAVAAACAEALTTGVFDARVGPYPEATMHEAWDRARLEAGLALG